jgi:hypothetical protein
MQAQVTLSLYNTCTDKYSNRSLATISLWQLKGRNLSMLPLVRTLHLSHQTFHRPKLILATVCSQCQSGGHLTVCRAVSITSEST